MFIILLRLIRINGWSCALILMLLRLIALLKMLLIQSSHLISSFRFHLNWWWLALICFNIVLAINSVSVLYLAFLTDIKLLKLVNWNSWWRFMSIMLIGLLIGVEPSCLSSIIVVLAIDASNRCNVLWCHIPIRQSALLLLNLLHGLDLCIDICLVGSSTPWYTCVSMHLQWRDRLLVFVNRIHHEFIDLPIHENMSSTLVHRIRCVWACSAISVWSKVKVVILVTLDLLMGRLLILLTILRVWMMSIVWACVIRVLRPYFIYSDRASCWKRNMACSRVHRYATLHTWICLLNLLMSLMRSIVISVLILLAHLALIMLIKVRSLIIGIVWKILVWILAIRVVVIICMLNRLVLFDCFSIAWRRCVSSWVYQIIIRLVKITFMQIKLIDGWMRWIHNLCLNLIDLECAINLILWRCVIGIIEVQVHLLALGLNSLLFNCLLILRKLINLIKRW